MTNFPWDPGIQREFLEFFQEGFRASLADPGWGFRARSGESTAGTMAGGAVAGFLLDRVQKELRVNKLSKQLPKLIVIRLALIRFKMCTKVSICERKNLK